MPAPTAPLPIVGNTVSAEARDSALNAALAENYSNIEAHKAATNNPHSTTKEHVGLGNVDNTSDANKPISNAQQAALDSKIGPESLRTDVDADGKPYFAVLDEVSQSPWFLAGLRTLAAAGAVLTTDDEGRLRLWSLEGGFEMVQAGDDPGFTLSDLWGVYASINPERAMLGGWRLAQYGDVTEIDTPDRDGGLALRHSEPAETRDIDRFGSFSRAAPGYWAGGGIEVTTDSDGRTRLTAGGKPLIDSGLLSTGWLPQAPVGISEDTITALNALTVDHPVDAHEPPIFSTDAETYGRALRVSHLACSITVTGKRMWALFFGAFAYPADTVPGSFNVLMYCDDLDTNVWHEVLYIANPEAGSGGWVRASQIATTPDGRLLLLMNSGGGSAKKISCYGILIANPEASAGLFEVGRPQWCAYGVPGQVLSAGDEMRVPVDEWSGGSPFTIQGQHYMRLIFDGRDGVALENISDAPVVADEELRTFPESCYVTVSAGRTRAWWRTLDGQYTSLSEPGDGAWGAPVPWADYETPSSRAVFARSPSGRICAAFNNHPTARWNLRLAFSEDDGVSFPLSVMLESRALGGNQAPSYPLMTFANGEIHVVAEFGRGGTNPLGKQIILYSIDEKLAASGTATEADVTKRIIMT